MRLNEYELVIKKKNKIDPLISALYGKGRRITSQLFYIKCHILSHVQANRLLYKPFWEFALLLPGNWAQGRRKWTVQRLKKDSMMTWSELTGFAQLSVWYKQGHFLMWEVFMSVKTYFTTYFAHISHRGLPFVSVLVTASASTGCSLCSTSLMCASTARQCVKKSLICSMSVDPSAVLTEINRRFNQ